MVHEEHTYLFIRNKKQQGWLQVHVSVPRSPAGYHPSSSWVSCFDPKTGHSIQPWPPLHRAEEKIIYWDPLSTLLLLNISQEVVYFIGSRASTIPFYSLPGPDLGTFVQC